MTLGQEANTASGSKRQSWRRFIPGAAGLGVVGVGCLAWAIGNFGSLHHAWLYAKGVRVLAEPATIKLADGKAGENREAVFLIHNLSAQPVNIVGVTTSCSCVSVGNLPLTISPRESREFRATIHLEPSPTGITDQSMTYRSDHPAVPSFGVRIFGRVIVP